VVVVAAVEDFELPAAKAGLLTRRMMARMPISLMSLVFTGYLLKSCICDLL
jgi:hypothetical protein